MENTRDTSGGLSTPPTPARVIMWSTPRSISTALEKCLSYVPDSVIWHEPYMGAMWYGTDRRAEPLSKTLHREVTQENINGEGYSEDDFHAVCLPEGVGYNENISSYGWCKEQLEADYPGKKLIFVKDMSYAVHTRYDAIPDGYTHSFLIRHPMKVIPSWRKLMSAIAGTDVKMTDLKDSEIPPGYFFKESHALMRYVKENFLSNPVIIDADDLLNNPEGMLKAYCESVGIPYSSDLLAWDSGDDTVSTWKIPRRLLRANKIIDCYGNAFRSTEFNRPRDIPPRCDLTVDELYCVDAIMPYYEELYAQRLTC